MRQPRKVYDARWKARHPDYRQPQYPEKARERYIANKEHYLAKANERYRNMTDEERAEHNRKRRERHARQPHVRNKVERKRDHLKRAGAPFDRNIWAIVKQKYNNACIYCGSDKNITVEHRQPVTLGGNNSFSNLAPACLSCNSSKRNKTEREYREWRDKQRLVTIPSPEIVYEWA